MGSDVKKVGTCANCFYPVGYLHGNLVHCKSAKEKCSHNSPNKAVIRSRHGRPGK